MIRTKKIEAIAEILYMQNKNRFETMKINNRALTVAYRIAMLACQEGHLKLITLYVNYLVSFFMY